MTANEIIKAVLELKFTELQAYLRNTGWARIDTIKQSIALFQKQVGTNFYEVLLPLSKDYSDYAYRIVDVLENIAQAESREVHQVLTDLSIPPGDTVRFRVINKDTIGGTISFLEGFNLLEAAKKALFTTACDIVQPEKYHKRLGLKGAQQFIEECRLGQTEKGSFIASVICPFINQTPEDKPKQLTIFNQADEFRHSLTRQVTTRLMHSLSEIKNAIDRGEENKIVELEGGNIISGNFLESIVELNSTTKETTEVEIITSWSVFTGEQPAIVKAVKFSNDYIPVLENIISKVKPIDKGIEDDFIGKISLTKADPDIHSRTEGEIILNYIVGDEEKVSKAKVILNNADYDKACEAHKQGKSVKIKGKLITIGRTKMIENPSFEVV
ncbi:hypothetical protein [Rurimicrobium arvi]|uniref:Uncharacterized protein n=1 Tax=Rurimicrobium arvi TaxID=2049916 RepID=A0ABP8MGG4_9BACT